METLELNAADLLILIAVGLACLHGLFRGLVRTLLWLATLVASVAFVWLYAGSFASSMEGLVGDATLRAAVAFLLIFGGVLLLGNWLIAKVLANIVSLAGLTVMDRILGGLFGIMWGVLLVCAALFLLEPFIGTADFWNQSLLVQLGLELIMWLATAFPQSGSPVVI